LRRTEFVIRTGSENLSIQWPEVSQRAIGHKRLDGRIEQQRFRLQRMHRQQRLARPQAEAIGAGTRDGGDDLVDALGRGRSRRDQTGVGREPQKLERPAQLRRISRLLPGRHALPALRRRVQPMAECERLFGAEEAVVGFGRPLDAQGDLDRPVAVEQPGQQVEFTAALFVGMVLADAAMGLVKQRLSGRERLDLAPRDVGRSLEEAPPEPVRAADRGPLQLDPQRGALGWQGAFDALHRRAEPGGVHHGRAAVDLAQIAVGEMLERRLLRDLPGRGGCGAVERLRHRLDRHAVRPPRNHVRLIGVLQVERSYRVDP
jgi:hypothetical protein